MSNKKDSSKIPIPESSKPNGSFELASAVSNGKLDKKKKSQVKDGDAELFASSSSAVLSEGLIDRPVNAAAMLGDKELLRVLMEVKNGNFSVRMPIDEVGVSGKICDTLNEIILMNQKMMYEFTRAGNTI